MANLNFSLGFSEDDPEPLFISNLQVQFNREQYYVQIPPLTNVDGMYLFLSAIVDEKDINIKTILIEMSESIEVSIDKNYGIINNNETFTMNINLKMAIVYIYYSILPDQLIPDGYVGSAEVINDKITFSFTSSYPNIYF